MKALPRLTPGVEYVIDGEVWNRVADFLEKADRLTVAAPLFITDSSVAKSIGIAPQREKYHTFRVALTQTSGSAGNKTTPVSFTYTVNDLNGTQLATAKAPEWPSRSENGLKSAATAGLAYYDASGVIQIAIAFERSGTTGC